MGIDTSMYNNIQGINIGEQMASGMRLGQALGDMRKQRAAEQKQAAISDLYKKNMVTGEDGSTSLNRKGVLGDLAKLDPMAAMEADKKFQADDAAKFDQDFEMNKKKTEVTKSLIWSIQDQQSYDMAKAQGQKMGLDNMDKWPQQFDPNLVKRMQLGSLNALEQINEQDRARKAQLEEQRLGLDKQKHYADVDQKNKGLQLEYDKLGAGFNMQEARLAHEKAQKGMELSQREQESLRKHQEFVARQGGGEKGLAPDQKKVVETLATKNANKTSIANQIDAVMGGWDKLSDDQKIVQGRMLLKTLNSPEGADAIGVEEANRLGSKLEFAMGNFTNSNPTQFGRDLEGFAEQARNAAKFIKEGVQSNQAVIDKTMGRESSGGFDSDVVAYAQKHGISPEQANAIKQQRMSAVGKK